MNTFHYEHAFCTKTRARHSPRPALLQACAGGTVCTQRGAALVRDSASEAALTKTHMRAGRDVSLHSIHVRAFRCSLSLVRATCQDLNPSRLTRKAARCSVGGRHASFVIQLPSFAHREEACIYVLARELWEHSRLKWKGRRLRLPFGVLQNKLAARASQPAGVRRIKSIRPLIYVPGGSARFNGPECKLRARNVVRGTVSTFLGLAHVEALQIRHLPRNRYTSAIHGTPTEHPLTSEESQLAGLPCHLCSPAPRPDSLRGLKLTTNGCSFRSSRCGNCAYVCHPACYRSSRYIHVRFRSRDFVLRGIHDVGNQDGEGGSRLRTALFAPPFFAGRNLINRDAMALLVLIGWAIPGSGGCQTFSHVVKWFEVEWRRSVEIIGAFASDSYERVLESTSKADSYSEAQVMRATCWVVALLILSSTMSLLTLMFLFRLLAAPCLFFQEGLRMSSTQLSRDRLLQRVAPEFELDEVAIQKMRAHDEGGPSVCVICLESFEALDRVRRIPCSHLYHASCFLTWFRISMRCPLCNKNARVS